MPNHRPWLVALASIWGLTLSGCSTAGFYAQAIHGQAEILQKARPTTAVLRDPHVPEKVKRQLRLVQEVRTFSGTHLGLPADREFDRYTDLGRRYVSWVVYAAPEFSVEGKTWWYPLVGQLKYRGFFTKAAADDEAARLRAHGWEVHVGGVEAYSTLGWFRDPVLNTFLRRTNPKLAELIIHELTHVKVFLPGDTDFNEALATAMAEEGVRRWLESKGDLRARAHYDESLVRDREIIRLLLRARRELEELYAEKSRTAEEMRRAKDATFHRMLDAYPKTRARWPTDSRYDRVFAKPWNNARLNTVATYQDLVPDFHRLLRKNHGDLDAFYTAIEAMRRLTKEERRAALGAS